MDDSWDIVIVAFGLEKVLISSSSCFTCCQGIAPSLILENGGVVGSTASTLV